MSDHLQNNNTENSSIGLGNPLEDFNPGLLLYIIRKSLFWIIVLPLLGFFLSWLYLRYTPNKYKTSSTLMLKTEKTVEILGLNNLVETDKFELEKEIELVKSNIFLENVANRLPLNIAYYQAGRTNLQNTELYKSSPFSVEIKWMNDNFINQRIYLKLEKNRALIKSMDKEEGDIAVPYDQEVKNKYFAIIIRVNRQITDEYNDRNYFFVYRTPAAVYDEIKGDLSVNPINFNNRTMSIDIVDENPQKAYDLNKEISEQYLIFNRNRKAESVTNILDFLNHQIDTFGTMYYGAQDSLNYFMISNNLFSGENQITDVMGNMKEAEQKQSNLQLENRLLEYLKNYIKSEKEGKILMFSDIEGVPVSFTGQINEINSLYEKKRMKLLDATEKHPEVVLLTQQIAEKRQLLLDAIDDAIKQNKIEAQKFGADYSSAMRRLYELPEISNKMNEIVREKDLIKGFYLNLVNQKSQYSIAVAGIVSDFIILKNPSVPNKPISPDKTMIKLIGFFAGVLLVLLIIVIRYLLVNEVLIMDEVKNKTLAPALGIIPKFKQNMESSRVVVVNRPKSYLAEAFRAIRSNLSYFGPDKKVIATSSTVPGEGKTFVGINLAAILAMMEKKVILIDLDLRKPRIASVFDVDANIGMSNLLSNNRTLEEVIQETEFLHLDVITAGPIPPNPSELINKKELGAILEQLKQVYDYILIDCPPVGIVTDALDIYKNADIPIYVLRAGYSKKEFLENINHIREENQIPLSVILNDFGNGASAFASIKDKKYGYGYGYGQKYSSGYGYYAEDDVPKGFFAKFKNWLLMR